MTIQPNPLFPPNLDEIEEFSEFRSRPEDPEAYSKLLESQCGATDDSQPVEQYNGTLGVTIDFVNTHQGPVGQLQWNNNLNSIYTNPGNVAGVRWCTGTLISNDLFLTAGHCFDQAGGEWQRPFQNGTTDIIPSAEIATNMQVNFNYQVDPSGNLRIEQSFPILRLVEYRLGGLDFAIVRLGGNPGLTFGKTIVSNMDANEGEMICIIGHPAGVPKRIEAGPVSDLQPNVIFYDDIDTLGGNSGSGILRALDGQIVGIHTNGGCTTTGVGSNSGVRMTSVIRNSPILQTRFGTRFLLQTGTALHETDNTFAFVVASNGDLFAIKKSGTGSNSTEVHVLSAASNYQSFSLQTGTGLHETDNTFAFALSSNRDLFAIKKQNTGSNSTEIHILSAASNYQNFSLQTGSALHETDETFSFAVTGNNDVIAIKKQNTGSNSTEIHILSAASNYQDFSLQTVTVLHPTDTTFDFALASNNDLFAIKKQNTDTNSTEVHILSASSNYSQFILQRGTVLHETDQTFAFGLTASRNLFAIKKKNTGTNSTEIHVIDLA